MERTRWAAPLRFIRAIPGQTSAPYNPHPYNPHPSEWSANSSYRRVLFLAVEGLSIGKRVVLGQNKLTAHVRRVEFARPFSIGNALWLVKLLLWCVILTVILIFAERK